MKKIIIYPLSLTLFAIICCSRDREDSPSTDLKKQIITPSDVVLQPSIGGSTLPNQVYINLSTAEKTVIKRTIWDLGFYSGDEFRVILNGAINKMAAKKLNTIDIDQVQLIDEQVTTGNYNDPKSATYIDHPSGDIRQTVIAAISEDDKENNVYLLNLGQEIADSPAKESFKVNMIGKTRNWKKIRILREGNSYKLQYADLEATTHKEIIIPKNKDFNFSFFSFKNNNIVMVEPPKEKWDLNFTTFTNIVPSGAHEISYFFPDFVVTNNLSGVRAYQLLTDQAGSYEAFELANVDRAKFETESAKDQRAIGSNWRVTTKTPPIVHEDKFFILKDAAQNFYKIKFISMYNKEEERGNITFQYKLLK